ncbi:MAG: succinate dehydrogenase cytochrome b subunit [Acidobacteriota bacterium]|jgi:succinate dehydrogenase / fumarate reductase cytochrome b subunit
MSWIVDFWRSNLGKKAVMAVSGIILFGFVLGHMLGNLKLYLGPEALNHYAEWLREMGSPLFPHESALWLFRLLLLAAVAGHMWSAWRVTRDSWKARPSKYERDERVQLDYAARTMRWGGVIIALFVVFHILHLTTGDVHADFEPGAVYHNVVAGFSVWWVSAIYILANLFLGLHLYHGLWSMFQSLGWNHPTYNAWRRNFAVTFAVVVTVGNVSFPVAVLTGLVS